MAEAVARCPTAAEIAFIDERLDLIFDSDPSPRKKVCHASEGSADLTRFEKQIYNAVLAMRRVPFDKPPPWTGGKSLFRWFTSNVTGIELADVDNSYCCEGDRIIVIRSAVYSEFDDVWVSDPDDCFGCGLIGDVGVMLHEARHAEGYLHTCGNYDQTFEEMGAWAVHRLWYIWLADHANNAYMRARDGSDNYQRIPGEFVSAYDSSFCTPPPPYTYTGQ
jgi:hypothetical protein